MPAPLASIACRFAPLSALAALLSLAGCGSGAACAECAEEKCADLFPYCEDQAACTCMIDCMGEGGIPAVSGCLSTCGLSERPAGFAQIEECVAVACPDRGDECATPDGYTPPEETVTCEGSGAGIGDGTLADCSFDPGLRFDPDGEVLQFESADGGVCVRLERRDDGPGDLANTRWTLLDVRIGPPGEVAHIDDPAAQCWYASHHNFRDWVHVWTGARHYDLVLREDGHDGTRTYELYAFEAGPVDAAACEPSADGAQCIDGPIALVPVNP